MAVPHLQKLFVAEGDQRVDAGGAAGWDPAGYNAGHQEQGGYGAQRDWVVGGDAPELRGDDAGYGEADNNAQDDAYADQAYAHADHEAEDVALLCSEGHADADFVGAAGGGVGEDAIDADGDEHEADGAEDGHEEKAEARSSVREGGDKTFERASEREGDVAVGGPDFVANGVHHGHRLRTGADEDATRAGAGHGVG